MGQSAADRGSCRRRGIPIACGPVCAEHLPGGFFPLASFGAPADPLLRRDAKNGDASAGRRFFGARLFFRATLPLHQRSQQSLAADFIQTEKTLGKGGVEASEPLGYYVVGQPV